MSDLLIGSTTTYSKKSSKSKDKRSFNNNDADALNDTDSIRSSSSSVTSRTSSTKHRRKSTRAASLLAMNMQQADVENIIVEGKKKTTWLQCHSLDSLPARTIYMYIQLFESTRELTFSLNNNDILEKDKKDVQNNQDDDENQNDASATAKASTGTMNAADYIEGGPNSAEFTLSLKGLGVSIIDSLATELLFLTVHNLSINAETDNDNNSIEIIANNLQIDNMMPNTEFPVLLQPKYISSTSAQAGIESDGKGKKEIDEAIELPIINIVVVQKKSSDKSIHYFPYVMIALQELNLLVEESLLYRIGAYVQGLSFVDGGLNHRNMLNGPITNEDRYNVIERLKDILDINSAVENENNNNAADEDMNTNDNETKFNNISDNVLTEESMLLNTFSSTSSTNGAIRLMRYTTATVTSPTYHFIEILQINSIQINVSFTRSVSTSITSEDSSDGAISTAAAPVKYLLDTVLVIVSDINDAPLQLKSLIIMKALGTTDTFVNQVSKHYIASGKRQILGLVGSIGILGNPTGLIKNLGSGVHSFFVEPAKGIRKGPRAFAKGAGKGTGKLLAGIFSGAGGTVSAVTGAVGDGVSKLTMDAEYVANRKKRAAKVKKGGVGTGAMEGSKALVGGIASGIGGLFYQPFKGARNGGVGGFFKGIGKGVVGVVTKPVAGTLEAVSNVTEGIANGARDAGSTKKRNKRGILRPRRILQGDERRLVIWHPLEGILRQHLESKHIYIDPDTVIIKTDSNRNKKVAKYLFHLSLPNAPSLMIVVTTLDIFLLGIHPEISEDTNPQENLVQKFKSMFSIYYSLQKS